MKRKEYERRLQEIYDKYHKDVAKADEDRTQAIMSLNGEYNETTFEQ